MSERFVPRLTPVCEIAVQLGDPLDFGVTRRFTPILGGTIRGIRSDDTVAASSEAQFAEILPGGGDRELVREEQGVTVVEIDERYDARTVRGSLIGVYAKGVRTLDERGAYFRVALRFETSDPELAELQRSLFVTNGVREADRVLHTVYRVD